MGPLAVLLASTCFAVQAWALSQSSSASHPCKAFPSKVSELQACSTASAFCSSYLSGTAGYTRTTTKTVDVAHAKLKTTITTTSTSSVTDVIATTITTAATSTSTVTTTSTSFTYDAYCAAAPAKKAKKLKQRAPADLSPQASDCGIANAVPTEVSGACECILASSTTVTITSTTGSAKVKTVPATDTVTSTTSITSTVTTTPVTTTTVAGTVVTTCASSFYIALDDPNSSYDGDIASLSGGSGDGSSSLLYITGNAEMSNNLFIIDSNGLLVDLQYQTLGNTVSSSASVVEAFYFNFARNEQGATVTCSIYPGLELVCQADKSVDFYYCDDGYVSFDTFGGCPRVRLYIIPSDGPS